jgi:hypothetical protein
VLELAPMQRFKIDAWTRRISSLRFPSATKPAMTLRVPTNAGLRDR